MAYEGSATRALTAQLRLRGGIETLTATGAITLTAKSANLQRIDPGGAHRNVTLPAEESSDGLFFHFLNAADAAENLVILDDGGSTIVTINQGEWAEVGCDGSAWVVYAGSGVTTIDSLTVSTLSTDTVSEKTAGSGVTADSVLLKDGVMTGGVIVPSGQVANLRNAGTGTGNVAARYGATATEGLEIRVYEATVVPAAIETNLLNLPANSVVYSVQGNCESQLTGGGTTATWSIGITGTVNKYGTAGNGAGDTLLKNGKLDFTATPTRVASAEQIKLIGAATGGAAAGDTALTVGSVRVRIVYATCDSLDDA